MNIKTDSRKVESKDIFIAIKDEGHKYIDDAIKNGASYIIAEKGSYTVPTMIVESTREFLNEYLKSNYSSLFSNIKFIGVTGTNGKTTSCFLIYELLKNMNVKVAYIGTLGFYIDDKINDLDNTTPDVLTLYNLLIECVKQRVTIVVMEVSSHALDQNRVYGINFDYVAFTNLTKEHLDYHKNMDNYLNAKLKLFSILNDTGVGIVNIDDKYSKYFKCNNLVTYGFNDSNFKIIEYKLYLDKIIYKFKYNSKIYKVKLRMPGKYNIYNSLLSIIILHNMSYKIKHIIKLLKNTSLPSGRMEIIKKNKAYVIIDYAHTPDAVSNVLRSVNEYKKRKVYTIIGCGGNRDKSKRKDIGFISTNLSDYVIFTSDNPRDEEPIDITNDITKDIVKDNYEVIIDRKEAIKKGINMLNKDDILLILGKGHEDYQIKKGIKYHFNDKEEVLKIKKA